MPKSTPLHIGGQFWFNISEGGLLGKERIALLEQIAERGSITQAAKSLKISYKAAWDAVDTMNNIAPAPVVETATGGRGGGGTRLTEEGRQLITVYHAIAAEYARFLDGINATLGDSAAALALLQRLAMRTSARNQLIGKVIAVTMRTVDAEVVLEIQGGMQISVGVTNESVELLRLYPNRQVWALIKAVAVSIHRAPNPELPSTINQLCGVVQRIICGEESTEVVIALPSGVTIRGLMTTAQLNQQHICDGDAACACFPASAVIIGVDN
ncbi:TOBE domain-containing protein [Chromatium okenii]|uniref:Molybdenum-dependent transcriptional regulator n=1 Tax=Chromatium okenii TaxID=61644 RepID=A0A2S7XSR2_9GAMM|nr:TOBE domain-containing protein [Chromatium okenii]MBV5307955.1 TOBE domain-containing protein [Chromatium okenii]PQJ96431.1 molybdenum-dependent transcriptional regulator [Chromatium okenii]